MDIIEKYNITDDEYEKLKTYFIKLCWKEQNDKKKEYRSNYYKQRKLKDEEFKKRCKDYNDKHNNLRKELRKLNKEKKNNENEKYEKYHEMVKKYVKNVSQEATIVES
tara:strand:- start:386 stop:709 length:324 start_codon:yes stop_codon:yes gene_type:complete